MTGSLATSTGPLHGGDWSIESRQKVHVGETVDFSFVLRKALKAEAVDATGLADYCVFDFGSDRTVADLNEDGGFRTRRAFDDVHAGASLTVTARAYRIVDDADVMMVAGECVERASPYNRQDTFVADAAVRMTVYQSEVDMQVPARADEYDFATGRLTLYGKDHTPHVVFIDKPFRPGFRVDRAGDGRDWRIRYKPHGDEVHPSGVTEVEFSVYDLAGGEHLFRDSIKTP